MKVNFENCFMFQGHYAVGEYIGEEALNHLQIMLTDLYYEYCVAMSYKTWPFKTDFDLLVLNVAASGIQKYWELQVLQFTFDYNVFLSKFSCKNILNLICF